MTTFDYDDPRRAKPFQISPVVRLKCQELDQYRDVWVYFSIYNREREETSINTVCLDISEEVSLRLQDEGATCNIFTSAADEPADVDCKDYAPFELAPADRLGIAFSIKPHRTSLISTTSIPAAFRWRHMLADSEIQGMKSNLRWW